MESFIQSDAGRIATGYTNEKNDCTVRAYAIAFNVPYYEAHKVLTQYGRKDRHGLRGWMNFINQLYLAGKILKPLQHCIVTRPIVRKWPLDHPKGNFMVQVRGHAFAVKDGIVFDMVDMNNRRHVLSFVEVIPKKEIPQ